MGRKRPADTPLPEPLPNYVERNFHIERAREQTKIDAKPVITDERAAQNFDKVFSASTGQDK